MVCLHRSGVAHVLSVFFLMRSRSRILIQPSDGARLGYAAGASCVSGCFSLAAAARACSRGRPPPRGVRRCVSRRPSLVRTPVLEEPTHHDRAARSAVAPHPHHRRDRHPAAIRHADPQVRPVRAGRHPRPHLAGQGDHRGPALAVHRPAGRQPGADRPDVARPASARCSTCWSGWATRRSRSASRPPARPTSTSCARSSRRSAIPDDVTISVLTQAREDLIERTVESLARRARGPPSTCTTPPRRCSAGSSSAAPGRVKQIAVDGTRLVMEYAEKLLGDETVFGYQYSPGDLHRHRAGLRPGGLRGGHGRLAARVRAARSSSTCPPRSSGPRPNVYADQIEWMRRNLSRREHVVPVGRTRTTTAAPPSPPPSWR